MKKLLSIKNLSVSFKTNKILPAVRNISFDIFKGEALGIVGESGSGKSVTALSILKLLPYPKAFHPSGKIFYRNKNILKMNEEKLQEIRGNNISMIFQEPMTSLNPLHNIKKQISETLFLHKQLSNKEAEEKIIELLNLVGFPDAKMRLNSYPHELSGGQKQRVMIAMALANDPELLIADEPTTALDVTIQAQILDLMMELKDKRKDAAILLITHDLAVVAETCDRIAVMYAGRIVELAKTKDLFNNPQHPYTVGLINSIPRINSHQEKLQNIPGTLKTVSVYNDKCPFIERCQYADNACKINKVKLNEIRKSQFSLCLYPERIK